MKTRILHGNDALRRLNEVIQELNPSRVFVLTDSNTAVHCLPILRDEIEGYHHLHELSFPAGEEHKILETSSSLWSALLEKEADRDSLLINLGGGVTTDLGGFVASTFKRGISFIQIPTSLLAMVDASVGGKTGIDFNGAKNQIGTFTEPEAVIIDTRFLTTLSEDELISGWAEVLKHGLIHDRGYWERCRSGMAQVKFDEVVAHSIEIKSAFVERDLHEAGIRKTLNFGHTIGHALESYFLNAGHPIKHGFAVATGMLLAAKLSTEIAGLSQDEFESIELSLLNQFQPLGINRKDINGILQLLKHDKKNVGGDLQFVLLKEIGNAQINVPVTEDQVRDVLHWYINNCHG